MKKKVLIIGLFFVFLLSLMTLNTPSVSAKQFKYPNGKNAQVGDVLVTSDAFANGFVGHTGIVTSSYQYMEIAGSGKHPTIKSLDKWFSRKNKPTKVVRINNKNKAELAGYWARMYPRNAKYKITRDLYDTQNTYCSKIVYQAYSIGSGVFHVYETPRKELIVPYSFLLKIYWPSEYNPKLVYSKGMSSHGDIK
ncbi:hypothetical protein MMJ63_07390 [Bacillus vallismortis]|nr:hypothetical protein [Bacillus vallismortis]